jgi:predicted ATPase/transcriptional regulator with XRE-family HTH domain
MEEQPAPVVFGEWLKRRRKALDITQDELANRAGCSPGALRKIEAGDRRPSKQLAGLLARALEIPGEELQTFIRVARGELNLERLGLPSDGPPGPLADLWTLHQNRQVQAHLPAPSHRIPFQATPLIGRDHDLAAIERIFNDPLCRLMTLTGVGGIGKTRLAIEFAGRARPAFPGGIFFVPLTPVKSPEKIVPAIADILDFGFSGPSDPREQLINFLASSIQERALFVFDNLEQLLARSPGGAEDSGLVELVSELLQRLPAIKILGTSRERLNLHGEWTYEVHGLSVPPSHYVERLEDYESIALFIRSAQRVKAGFQVTDHERLALVQICQLVEGVPLAIELAAAWAGMLSCQEIAQEIQSNMDFLATSMRGIPDRHRSIRATFDHSWNLLSGEERQALAQLSVFQGGFDRVAAQEIAGASLALLASLSDKSLVRRAVSGRYDLHEVIRQYALHHLHEQSRKSKTYARHCEYYLQWLAERERSLKRAAQQEALRQLTDDIDNIRAAWAWAIQNRQFSLLGKSGRAFGWYFEIAGLYREGIEQLELLVQAIRAGPLNDRSQRILGLALVQQALLFFRKGEFVHARQLYEDSIGILHPVGDSILLADALIYSGTILHLMGEFDRAASSLEQGLELSRSAGDRWFEAYAICNLGYIESIRGRYEAGYQKMMSAVAIWRSLGDPHAIALGLNFLVPTLNNLGCYEEAKANMRESIALCEQSRNRWGMGTAYRYLGLAMLAGGQFEEAQTNFRKSLEIFGDFTVGWDLARSTTYLGDAARLAGDLPAARRDYLEGLRLAIEAKSIPIAFDALAGLAYLHAQAGDLAKALLLSIYISEHPASEVQTKQSAEQLRGSIEPELDHEQAELAKSGAQEITFDETIQLATEGIR